MAAEDTPQTYFKRLAERIQSNCEAIKAARMVERILFRFPKWAMIVLRDEWTPRVPSPLQRLIRYRDKTWWTVTQEEEGLRKRTRGTDELYRHRKPGVATTWEDVLVDHYGLDWKEKLEHDPAAWCATRGIFVKETCKRWGLKASSWLLNGCCPEADEGPGRRNGGARRGK